MIVEGSNSNASEVYGGVMLRTSCSPVIGGAGAMAGSSAVCGVSSSGSTPVNLTGLLSTPCVL